MHYGPVNSGSHCQNNGRRPSISNALRPAQSVRSRMIFTPSFYCFIFVHDVRRRLFMFMSIAFSPFVEAVNILTSAHTPISSISAVPPRWLASLFMLHSHLRSLPLCKGWKMDTCNAQRLKSVQLASSSLAIKAAASWRGSVDLPRLRTVDASGPASSSPAP